MSRTRKTRAMAAAAVIAFGATGVIGGQGHSPVVSAVDVPRDGTTPERAGASCWSIKQDAPSSVDGVFWLQPDSMAAAEPFYCDMTTDGGGWVLIGRGRDNWTFFEHGQGTATDVRDVVTGPAAFAPAALDTLTIDALLGGGDVKDLVDGIRVRRAADIDGTSWQELRWELSELTSWSWAINGGHRMDSFSIDGVTYTGPTSTRDSLAEEFGVTTGLSPLAGVNDELRWFTWTWSGHDNRRGFSYGTSVQGGNDADDYLWENANEGAAIPFAQVFVRPRLTDPVGAAIPDVGLPAETLSPRLSDRHDVMQAGVVGLIEVGDTESTVDTPIQAFAEYGDVIYVGGKFANVELGPDGALEDQPYLAAFDRDTGAWIDTFRPDLDGTVWELEVVGDRMYVAGQFTNIDGVAGTSALAAIDLTTGQVDTTWQADIATSGTTDRPIVRSLDVHDGFLYGGGLFTSVTTFGTIVPTLGMARMSLVDGSADTVFRPNFNDAVYDIEVVDERVHVVGIFTEVNGESRVAYASIDRVDGELTDGFGPLQPARPAVRQYQQAVLEVNGDVWIGGNGHTIHAVDETDGTLLKAAVTGNRGGDTQAYAEVDGYIVHGSHANRFIFRDSNLYPVPSDHARIDNIHWMGLFDATTREYVVDWVPQVDTQRNEGAWSLYTDADDCVWFGGDFNAGDYIPGGRKYINGFSKYCQRDTVAPSVPVGPTVEVGSAGVTVRWGASTDDRAGFIGYEVLRNDRVVSNLVYGSAFVDADGAIGDRYFVRAVDAEGNRSATTSVLTAGADVDRPAMPTNVVGTVTGADSADLGWDASVDAPAVLVEAETGVPVGGTEVRTTQSGFTGTGFVSPINAVGRGVDGIVIERGLAGSAVLDVRYAAGGTGDPVRTLGVLVNGERVATLEMPQTAAWNAWSSAGVTVDLDAGANAIGFVQEAGDTGRVILDSVTHSSAVAEYRVYRNGVEIATSPMNSVSVSGLLAGNNFMQVEAVDSAGNVSFRTPSTIVFIDGQRPSTPQNLVATLTGADTADLMWTASTDDVAVTGYAVFRNGVEVATSTTPSVSVSGLVPGNNYIQVEAEDAAGNVSFKTPPIVVEIAPPDTQSPSTPQNLVGVVTGADSADLTWTASADDVGVTGYTVFRNGVAIATSLTNAASITGLQAGNNYVQVQAFDAAGNESFKTPPIIVVIDSTRPSVPRGVQFLVTGPDSADLVWVGSTDNVGVTGYSILRNGVEIATSPTTLASVTGLQPGNNFIQVRAFDAAGNESLKTSPVIVEIDAERPSTPQNLTAEVIDGDVELTWDESTDNVGVTGYTIRRNGEAIATAPSSGAFLSDLPGGTNYIQVEAEDAAGNVSFRTPPLVVYVDVQPPTTPQNLVATVVGSDTVELTWDASTDDVGVGGYAIFRNGVFIAQSPTNSATVGGLASGDHYLQVQAFDTVPNFGFKTPPIIVVLP